MALVPKRFIPQRSTEIQRWQKISIDCHFINVQSISPTRTKSTTVSSGEVQVAWNSRWKVNRQKECFSMQTLCEEFGEKVYLLGSLNIWPLAHCSEVHPRTSFSKECIHSFHLESLFAAKPSINNFLITAELWSLNQHWSHICWSDFCDLKTSVWLSYWGDMSQNYAWPFLYKR